MSSYSNKKGYIPLPREIQDDPLYPTHENRRFTRWEALVDLRFKACYQTQTMSIQGTKIIIERGSLITTATQLADYWKWDRETVERYLKRLEKEGKISRTKVNPKNKRSATILKINNYNEFPPKINNDPATNTATGTTTDATAINNNKKNNNLLFIKPTVQEVKEYCEQRGKGLNAEYFHSYYEANGWMRGKNKMQDWKAAVRYWEEKAYNKPAKPLKDPNAEIAEIRGRIS